MELCKVRFDGSHFLIAPYKNMSSFDTCDLILKSNEELGIDILKNKKDFFINEWALENYPFKNKGRKKIEDKFVKLHDELKKLYYLLNGTERKFKEKEMINNLYECILNEDEFVRYYHIDVNNEITYWLYDYIRKFVIREKENLKGRKGLFKRKAISNEWNYFVTFTYDDKKHTEDSFVKTLKKKLQNYHTNYGWLYMGAFERGNKTNRLHLHALISVPNGKMRGKIRHEKSWDNKQNKMVDVFVNEEFESKIGRNDFKSITKNDLTFSHALDYIIKYIGKSDNKIVYSRGIRDDYYCLCEFEDNVICKVSEKSPYYVMANTNMIELNKKMEFVNTNF